MEWAKAFDCDRDGGGSGSGSGSIREEEVVGEGVEERRREPEGDMGAEGYLYVQVMTDEQIEVLRRQIAVYAVISEQLVEMHKAFTAQQDSVAGTRLGGLYTDSLMVPEGHKITTRQRWTPSSMQLHILEAMFDQCHGTPNKQKIKEITLELSLHGHISETNVYNWFQNRRARSKRKHIAAPDDESPPSVQKQANQRSHDESALHLQPLCDGLVNDNSNHLFDAEHNETQQSNCL